MPSDEYKITVNERTTLTHKTGQSLLESLESENVEVEFHCRNGFCGACRVKLIEGEVDYKTDPLAFIADDEILLCCCEPVSDLKIEIT